MNRPRKHHKHLPRNMQFRHSMHYYVKGGVWTPIGRTYKEALKRFSELYDAQPGSMGDLIARALPHITKDKKTATIKQYEIAARRLSKMLAEFRPEDVEQKHVAGIKLQLAKTPNMANRCLSVLRLVFAFATENQIVSSNPAIGVRRHKEAKRDRLLSKPEFDAIREAAGPRLKVIMDLLVRTGQRVNDVLRIRRADLLDEGIAFTQQKTGAKLVVKWNDELREVVKRAKTLNANIRALTLLHNRRGKTPDYRTVRKQWDDACTAARVSNAHLHDLRAMSATWAERQGIDATPLMGHTSSAQTVRYLRDRDAKVTEAPSFGQSKNLLDKGR
jgi:integrase